MRALKADPAPHQQAGCSCGRRRAIRFGRWVVSRARVLRSAAGDLKNQFGRQGEEEASHQSPERDLPGETAADGQDLADDVQQRTRGQRQAADERIGGAERGADDGAEEGRSPADQPRWGARSRWWR
jgi:hypothetical protein